MKRRVDWKFIRPMQNKQDAHSVMLDSASYLYLE